MRLQFANKLGVVAVLGALASVPMTAQADTITTISGDTYEVKKLLKTEDDGITVKHANGISKIPFYELSSETQERFGHTGEVRPKVRHRITPDSALLPELDEIELDLEAPEGPAAEEVPYQVEVDDEYAAQTKGEDVGTAKAAPRLETVVRKFIEVKVSAIGCASKAAGENRGPVTTQYTPYGNYSYYGMPGNTHNYIYFNPPPPCNRCYFERRERRRWQGSNRGPKVSRFPFAHYPH
jgi:hypothetical protein